MYKELFENYENNLKEDVKSKRTRSKISLIVLMVTVPVLMASISMKSELITLIVICIVFVAGLYFTMSFEILKTKIRKLRYLDPSLYHLSQEELEEIQSIALRNRSSSYELERVCLSAGLLLDIISEVNNREDLKFKKDRINKIMVGNKEGKRKNDEEK